ncbi:recombinase family protein [Moraxella atlantae]|uniref:DNA-invertase hin n=1 Tax=Faucicola atlantae TaxID=34059 RepID=A0A378QL90_9GAMM|nr:recombinase family protein [Moraxella atlantae]OPH35247.1 invertase [Moraxella atlantae]STZ01659.1 DNA-invertase hin [Moraxella atlantae]
MTTQKVGYARVSTKEQDLSLQLDALNKFDCDKIFTDKVSSVKQRQGLQEALGYLRQGDSLVVWKLDRLCRSLPDLIKISEQIKEKGAELISITENIDTSTPAGRLYFNILGALGQMERELIQERVKAGLAAARKRGKVGGKPRVSQDKIDLARRELSEGRTYPDVAKIIGIHPQTLYRLVPVKSLDIE